MFNKLLVIGSAFVLSACAPEKKFDEKISASTNTGANAGSSGIDTVNGNSLNSGASGGTNTGNTGGTNNNGGVAGNDSNPGVTIFRLYKAAFSDHLYSRSSSEGASIGYQVEDAFSLHKNPAADLKPIYRCQRTGGSHFVSGQPDCEGQIVEGLLGYAKTAATSKPLFRCYSASLDRHVLTMSKAECAAANYAFEIQLGYALE